MRACSECGRELEGDFQFCPYCGASPGAQPASGAQRKTVTVLFCDVTDSTALGDSTDPEALRALLARYFERMKTIVESHGGTVEKFIGDAVMAVFGVPVVHEDDALRAVRSAIEMREALPELGVNARIGLNTGEVVAGTEERLATGDAVNVAARLEQSASPDEILLGEATLELVRDAVKAEPVEPFTVKGKPEPLVAYRLVSLRKPVGRRLKTAMVGREIELERLQAAFKRAVAARSCVLFTIVGEPGVGKSRLVQEFLSGVDATIVGGRCLPYGEGITYWPVVEAVKQLGVRPGDPAAAAALDSLLGETEAAASAEEIAWGFRKALEHAAAEDPLVVVFDDIQWGEKTFLDLVEHIGLLSRGAPILLLCMARRELTEYRTGWPVALSLGPLSDDSVLKLVPETIDADLRERIARTSGGNPLFVEEMVAMAAESDGEVTLPSTLQVLLAARLDQLGPSERRVLECAAVEGEIFHRGAVRALAGEDDQVTPHLAALVRRALISPHRAQVAGEDGFRFHHLLIRDAAYEALTKANRAELHERLADWLGKQELVELDELLGYHLEQAARYKAELGAPDPALAERAGSHLAAAGQRAFWRTDEPAAASLLQRALELTRPLHLDVHVELALTDVLSMVEPRKAAVLAEKAAERAQAEGDRAGAALARVVAAEHLVQLANVDVDELETLARAALSLLEQESDHAGLSRVWESLAYAVANARGHYEDMAGAAEQAIRHAGLAGQPAPRGTLALALLAGPRPADEALRTLDASAPENPGGPEMLLRAVLTAMLGRFDEAWPLAHEANERLSGLRGEAEEAWLAEIATLEGDHEAAERYLRRSIEFFEARGMHMAVSGFAPQLARLLCAQGRHDEAAPLAEQGRRLADEQDAWAQVLWRQAQALVDSASGKHAEAEHLAREATAIAERTDALNWQGGALRDLAEVLAAADRADEATATLEYALERYERKKNLAMAAQVQARLG